MGSSTGRPPMGPLLAAGALAAAPAAWWVSGLGPEADLGGARPDYAITPPGIGSTAELVIGLVAVAVVAAGAAVLGASVRAGALATGWVRIVAAVALAAAYVGLTYRTGTEPVIGANIGYGLMVFGAIPVLGGLGVMAVLGARSLRS